MELRSSGWRVAVVWECALKRDKKEGKLKCIEELTEFLTGSSAFLWLSCEEGSPEINAENLRRAPS
jgi:G:T-mismatch repair DNA endonuclease (very short patch repair protein)